MSGKVKSIGLIAGMVLSWTVYYAVSKIMVDASGSPYATGFLLRSSAFVFLAVQSVISGDFRELYQHKKTLFMLILIGVLGFLLDAFANLGYAGSSLSTGTALLKTDVLIANIATVVIYHKRLYPSDWVGTFVMLFGVLMVLGIDLTSSKLNPCDLFFILSAVCVTANAFIIKAAQEKYHLSPNIISYYNNFVVLLLFGVVSTVKGDLVSGLSSHIPSFWLLTALGGLAQAGIYFFYYRNLKNHDVWVVKLYLLLVPVLSCLIGVLILDEVLTPVKLCGIAVVLAGAVVILLRNSINHGRPEQVS